jgi:hypothetical protein
MHLEHAYNAQRYFLELMAIANHNIYTVPESFLSSKILHLQYTMMNQRNNRTSSCSPFVPSSQHTTKWN